MSSAATNTFFMLLALPTGRVMFERSLTSQNVFRFSLLQAAETLGMPSLNLVFLTGHRAPLFARRPRQVLRLHRSCRRQSTTILGITPQRLQSTCWTVSWPHSRPQMKSCGPCSWQRSPACPSRLKWRKASCLLTSQSFRSPIPSHIHSLDLKTDAETPSQLCWSTPLPMS